MIGVIRTDFYGWIFNIIFSVIIKAAASILTNQGEHKVLPDSCRVNAGGLSQTSRRWWCARPSLLSLVVPLNLGILTPILPSAPPPDSATQFIFPEHFLVLLVYLILPALTLRVTPLLTGQWYARALFLLAYLC